MIHGAEAQGFRAVCLNTNSFLNHINAKSIHQSRLRKERLFITFAAQKPPPASALLGGERRSCSLAGEAILPVCESAKGREMRRAFPSNLILQVGQTLLPFIFRYAKSLHCFFCREPERMHEVADHFQSFLSLALLHAKLHAAPLFTIILYHI